MKDKDSKLMRRLLTYAKPYKWWFALVLCFMLIATAADLMKPRLIGSAVDLFTEGYRTPFIEKTTGQTVAFDGKTLGQLTAEDQVDTVYQMIQYKDYYYWLEQMPLEDAKALLGLAPAEFSKCITVVEDGVQVQMGNLSYHGRVLAQDELKVLRSLNMTPLFKIGVTFFGVLLVSFVLVYLQVLVLQHVGQKIILAIRQEIYEKMLNLPFRFYHNNPIGKLVTRVTNDTETLNEMYTSVLVNLLKQGFFIVGVMIMMLQTHVTTAVFVLCIMPLIIIATIVFKYISRKAYREVRNKLTEMNTFLAEHLSGMRIIQIFTREKAKVQKMSDINDELYKAGMKELIAFTLFRPFIFFLSYIGIGGVLLIGGHSVLAGTMSVGALVIMVSYTKDFFAPIEELAENFNVLQSAFASAEKIFSILDEENEIIDGTTPVEGDVFKGSIEFKNVWFAYEGEDWILKDVSFKIEPGQKVAFVGATGAGKTSILSLICRYYDIQKGEILIDGKPIADYRIADLRKQIGQVLQDVFLFTGDIKSNIRLGEERIGIETVEEAAKLVNADGFIKKLPHGYDEEVIERGASLSTGQRQLISFARAVAFNPKIFILDEATANIDTETEGLIQDALYKMMEGRTTLMVAHRLSTIQHADNIIVLHKGVVREMGDHQALLSQEGIYYNLYQLALKSQVMA
ncbi:MAG: ABC transporter ATP-binding protein [Cellulosilyticaceae bacterium]